MWLKIVYKNGSEESTNSTKVFSISFDILPPISDPTENFRVSSVFPLDEENCIKTLANGYIYFLSFENAYRVLGRVSNIGGKGLQERTFFSLGLASIILITEQEESYDELMSIANATPNAIEIWKISNSTATIEHVDIKKGAHSIEFETLPDYSTLHISERAIIDEFFISIRLVLIKLNSHMPGELLRIESLIDEVRTLVTELIYIQNPKASVPESLSEFSNQDLNNKKIAQQIWKQNLDRIIQVNSALSYISTQAFSGAIPILERRSLIRRNSFLGIGSAMLALNRITRYIEDAFSQIPFNEIITEYMPKAAALNGIEELAIYDKREWYQSSIDLFSNGINASGKFHKLPYFSGRLGYRETEYSIAAALQSLSSGSGLEWSLMTLTHEMLHGHVRNIISAIFYGDKGWRRETQRTEFYNRFKKKHSKRLNNERLIDSVRNIILYYCSLTFTHGSLSLKIQSKTSAHEPEIVLPLIDDLWSRLEQEYRNISEIFVHVLDLHYFYASRVSVYIPLIWASWVSLPHINGDLRQYILRSLLSLASKEDGSAFDRFLSSVLKFKEILEKYQDTKLNHPTIKDVIEILNDRNLLNSEYFFAFKASLFIVDLVKEVFTSKKIRSFFLKDDFVNFENDEASFEQAFTYELPNGFNDESIAAPLAYLLHKMIIELENDTSMADLEKETAIMFLALNSTPNNY
ncbi:hypothetical protein QQ054_38575 [Oscillatoria amoena NRMC-F 0135]|nr:hypothetical protein [Oscillatoria amoena NRMC-F 0135]